MFPCSWFCRTIIKMDTNTDHIIREAFSRHATALQGALGACGVDMVRGAEALAEALLGGHRVFVCGNGGSAADSQHFAAEFMCRYRDERDPLPVIALTTDSSILTAVGNDYRFEDIFSRQVRALGSPGDLLLAFTTSGGSKNVLHALEEARVRGLRTVVLTGEKGKNLAESADIVVAIPATETARIQEVHEVIYHAWCEYIDSRITPVK